MKAIIKYLCTQVNSVKNYNVVCFYPKDFKFIDFSDEIYTVKSINYLYDKLNESYKNYYDYDLLLNFENQDELKRKEYIFEYLKNKIHYENKNNMCIVKRER